MYDFILQIIVMLSLGAVIYLMARAVPRVTEMEVTVREPNYFDKLLKKLPLEKIDAFLSSVFEKFLRKSKVFILKADNSLTRHLHNLKPDNAIKVESKPALFENVPATEPVEKKEDLGNSNESK